MRTTYLLLALAFLAMASCSEDKLTPSPEKDNELIAFPQGDNTYDKEFEQFYDTYGVQVLYKYTQTDFRWNVTSYLPYTCDLPDDKYIEPSWQFIKNDCLSIWGDDFLKQYLPFRILLSSQIYSVGDTNGDDKKDTIPLTKTAIYGLNHITFGKVNSSITQMTADEKKQAIGDMAFALIGYATSQGKIEIPSDFTALHNKYGNNTGSGLATPDNPWGYNAAGFFEYLQGMDVYYDFAHYVRQLVMNSQTEFTDKYLNDTFDCGAEWNQATGKYDPVHPIRSKYEIVLKYFKEKFGIDLHSIGNKVSEIK